MILGIPLFVILFVILPAMAQMVRAGYGPEDLRRALAQLEQSATEEHTFAGGARRASERSRARDGWFAWCIGTLGAVAGAAVVANALWAGGRVSSGTWTQAILLLGVGAAGHVASLAYNSPATMASQARLKLPGMKSVGIRFLRSSLGSAMLSGLSRVLRRRK